MDMYIWVLLMQQASHIFVLGQFILENLKPHLVLHMRLLMGSLAKPVMKEGHKLTCAVSIAVD